MKKGKLFIILAVTFFTLIGGFLRFHKITQNPPSLTGDEVSFGYSAYSVLKTGRDEFGVFLPLVFKSVGDYKNPVPAYLMMLPISIFGLTDFAVRLPNALLGTLAIPIFFLFLKYIFKDKKIALVGAFFLAISSWHIFYSRFAYEPVIAGLFDLLGIWFYMKVLDGKKNFIFPSAFFLILSMYTGFSTKLFVPVFIIGIIIYSLKKHGLKKNFFKNYKHLIVFLAICAVLAIPLAYTIIFNKAATRLQMVLISNDVEFCRYVILKFFDSIADLPYLFFFWLKRYLAYFRPDFIFFNGLHMTTLDNFGLGLLYVFEIPWFFWGIYAFIKKRMLHKNILLIWLLTGIFPDSLTNNQQHGGRLLHIAPIIIMFSALGFVEFIKWIVSIKNWILKLMIIGFYSAGIVLILIHAFLVFSVHFPRDKSEYYDEGLKEVSLYVGQNQDKYKEIVFDTRHGVDAPDMISNPFLYLVFYLKYDPFLYQTEPKNYGSIDSPYYHFNKYTFRYINWYKADCAMKDTLLIGSPWSFPKDLKTENILKTIYLTNGSPAYYVVTPTCQ